MGVIFMDETRLERGLAATIPADVADYDRHPDAGSTRQWARSIGLAAAVGIAYFLAARLSLFLLTKPTVWPCFGRLPVLLPASSLRLDRVRACRSPLARWSRPSLPI